MIVDEDAHPDVNMKSLMQCKCQRVVDPRRLSESGRCRAELIKPSTYLAGVGSCRKLEEAWRNNWKIPPIQYTNMDLYAVNHESCEAT